MTITITPGQIKYIKTLARQVFGGDDTAYREMLWGQARVKSCKDLKGPQIDLVIRHLEKCLGQEKARDNSLSGQVRLIKALWDRVSYAPPGPARDKALQKFLRNRFQVGAVAWLTPAKASDVIEALKEMVKRSAGGTPAPTKDTQKETQHG